MNYFLFIFYFIFISSFAQDNYPYLDSSLSYDKRIDDLMSRMTLYEKACQMNQFVGLEHVKNLKKIYLLMK